ncbi:TraB/GumN family protein [Candidatus Woesearchaeota archaeon]|nr:TraB/GumN family protein [Candidatus Woesearchaeota archaeon]
MDEKPINKPITRVKLLGTSHIAAESVKQIQEEITKNKPDIITIELDKKRLFALMSQQKHRFSLRTMFKVGIKGYFFALLGSWGSKKLGNLVGAIPGREMLEAVTLARKNHIHLALIDQDIEITLQRFSKAITWREKWRFIKEIFRAIFKSKEVEQELGIDVRTLDLKKVPSQTLIKKLTKLMKQKYPQIYRVLVEERNTYMARNILHLIKQNPGKKILIIVGAGHIEGLLEILNKK